MGDWWGEDGQVYDSWDKMRGANNRYRQQQEQNRLLKEQNRISEENLKKDKENIEKERRFREEQAERDRQENEENRELQREIAEKDRKSKEENAKRIEKSNNELKEAIERAERNRQDEEDERYYKSIENKEDQIYINEKISILEKKIMLLKDVLNIDNISQIKESLSKDIELLKEFIGKDYSLDDTKILIKANINQLENDLKLYTNKKNYYKIVNFLLREDIVTYTYVEDYEKYDSTIDYEKECKKVIEFENKKRQEITDNENKGITYTDEESIFVKTRVKPILINSFEDEGLEKIYIPEYNNIEENKGEEIYEEDDDNDYDPYLPKVLEMMISDKFLKESFSASKLQKELEIGYARAGRIIDQLEMLGVISGYKGAKPREIIKTKDEIKNILNEINN